MLFNLVTSIAQHANPSLSSASNRTMVMVMVAAIAMAIAMVVAMEIV